MSAAAISPLRRRMLEDMSARKLNPHTQRSHISSCKRFAAYLKRLPDTATADDIRFVAIHLIVRNFRFARGLNILLVLAHFLLRA